MYIKNLLIPILGMSSGILTFFIVWRLGFMLTMYYTPGIIFGIFMLLCLYILKIPQRKMSLVFVIFSTLGSIASVNTTLYLLEPLKEFAFLSGGIIGTVIMLTGFSAFIRRLTTFNFIVLTSAGGVLALSWYIIPNGIFLLKTQINPLSYERFFSLYFIWQTSMLTLLGFYLPDPNKKT